MAKESTIKEKKRIEPSFDDGLILHLPKKS